MRQLWFAQIAKALIVFPGGFGTMDELWEMLTLLQTGKLAKRNLILIYGRKYWDDVLNWRAMVRWGTINEEEYKLHHSLPVQHFIPIDRKSTRLNSSHT